MFRAGSSTTHSSSSRRILPSAGPRAIPSRCRSSPSTARSAELDRITKRDPQRAAIHAVCAAAVGALRHGRARAAHRPSASRRNAASCVRPVVAAQRRMSASSGAVDSASRSTPRRTTSSSAPRASPSYVLRRWRTGDRAASCGHALGRGRETTRQCAAHDARRRARAVASVQASRDVIG